MASGPGSAPRAPRFIPINEQQVASDAKNADVRSYDMSDADWAQRFPQLAQGRTQNITNAVSDMQGGADPQVSQAMSSAGLSRNLGSNEFQKARSLGMPILGMEKRDRNYFQTLLSDNPQRTAGLNSTDVAQIALENTGYSNQFAQANFASNINSYNSQLMQNSANNSALISALGSIGSAGIRGYQYANSPYGGYHPSYLNLGGYDPSSYGGFAAPFSSFNTDTAPLGGSGGA